jgi:hypothetical protein
MIEQAVVRVVAGASVCAAALLLAAPARAESPCAVIARQTDATVIAFEPPGTFTICRGGHVESDVVTGRPVYVELVAGAGEGLMRFRVHGHATQIEPTGLLGAAQRLGAFASDLRALASSAQTIAEASGPPASGPPPGIVEQARALYLGVATPRFHDGIAQVGEQIEQLGSDADVVARWCREPTAAPPALASELRARCSEAGLAPAAVRRQAVELLAAIGAYQATRDAAREALVAARARLDEGSAQIKAVALLDDARSKASGVVDRARRLAPVAAGLASTVWLVREAVRSTGTLRAGVPYALTRYSRSGIASLEIDSGPIELSQEAPEGPAKAQSAAESTQTFRFPVISVHYLDLEAGIAAIAGAPQVPTLNSQNVIEGKSLDQFVGLALVEIEPARWLWPDRPLAGVLRFPVIGIPFTRDPTQNFFGGIGLGWTGVGSISAGPYLLRELSLQNGASIGSTVTPASGQTAAQAFAALTGPQLQVGYFVSASIDLIGLFHVFVPVHEPVLDATTGAELH